MRSLLLQLYEFTRIGSEWAVSRMANFDLVQIKNLVSTKLHSVQNLLTADSSSYSHPMKYFLHSYFSSDDI